MTIVILNYDQEFALTPEELLKEIIEEQIINSKNNE